MGISLREKYVFTQDYKLLGRPFKKGQEFPLRRYRRVARMLLRRKVIAKKPEEHAIEVKIDPGEGPFEVKHRGGGRWAVVNAGGVVVSSLAPKAFVAALAEEMNGPQETEGKPDGEADGSDGLFE